MTGLAMHALFAPWNCACRAVRSKGVYLAALLVFCGRLALSQDSPPAVPEANPARPTVATPATLTPVGYLQFENGIFYAEHSQEFSGLFALNQVTKLTVNPRLELMVQSGPLAYSGLNGVRGVNSGDVLVGTQFVVLPGSASRPTVALSYLQRVYAGTAPDVDFGSPERSLILLISHDLGGFHFDLNGMFNEQTNDTVRRGQFGQTISISHKIKKKFGIGGELWHFTQPFLRSNAVGNLSALSYQPRPNMVFDAGFNRGLTSTSTRWETFAGFTYVLPHRLWKGSAEVPKTPP